MRKSSLNRQSVALKVALVGIMAATVECGKLVLASIPNVEVVTLLIGLYSYTFGWLGILASLIFVCIEPLIWGLGTWVISYFIYWPLVALIFAAFGAIGVKNRVVLTSFAVVLTFLFGVLTALVDGGLFTGNFDNFLYRFGIYYARGIVFYALQIACNLVLFLFVFRFLADKIKSLAYLNKK